MKALFYFLLLFFLHQQIAFTQHDWTRTNPGGGGAFSTIEAGPTGQVIAGSDLSGAYYSWDGGLTWDVYGAERGMPVTHVSGMGFHPSDGNIFYLGTDSGIYKSTTGGGFLYEVLGDGYITDIQVAPSNPQRVYATYHPFYNSNDGVVYRSTDGGENFSPISNSSLPNGLRLLKLLVHPTNPDIVYALSGFGRFADCSPAVVYRSTNGGVQWQQIATNLGDILDMAIHPSDGNQFFVTTMNADCDAPFYWTDVNGSFYKSTDGGTSWGTALTDKTGVIWIKFDLTSTIRLIDPREPFPWNPKAGTYESTNSGTTWTKVGDVNNWQTGYHPQGNDGLFWSYQPSYNGICKSLGMSMAESDVIFWTNYQWAFTSYDGGRIFRTRHTTEVNDNWWQSNGFDNIVMNDIVINESNPDEIYASLADIGLWRSLDHGASWQSCNHADYTGNWNGYGGNSLTVLTDPERSGVVWAGLQGDFYQDAFLVFSNQAAEKNSWTLRNTGLPTTNRISGLSLDVNSPTNNRTLFVAINGDIYRSQNDGNNWSLVKSDGGLFFTEVDKFNSNVVYAAGRSGVWRSTDGGDNWASVGLPEMSSAVIDDYWGYSYEGISDIETDPNHSGWLYVTAVRTGQGLYRSKNSGTTWEKLYDNEYMRCVAVSRGNSDLLYAGSSSAFYAGGYTTNSEGVLYSEDGGMTWESGNEQMAFPFAVVLEIDTKSPAHIFVGSPGTGFQFSPLVSGALAIDNIEDLTAIPLADKVQLSWQQPLSTEHLVFEIERSVGGQDWDLIERLTAQNRIRQYQVFDKTPLEGMAYYRLKTMDEGGGLRYSRSVAVEWKTPSSIHIQPNPITDRLAVFMPNIAPQTCQFQVFDMQGQLVLEQVDFVQTDEAVVVDLSTLSSGVYVLRVLGEEVKWIERILKE